MLITIMGDSCTGKSTVAKAVADKIGAQVFGGKDYLRMAKNEDSAAALFREKLENSVCGENIIYVITEKELLSLVPEGGTKVFVNASLDTIKERFAARTHGVLPPPVAAMLERNITDSATRYMTLK